MKTNVLFAETCASAGISHSSRGLQAAISNLFARFAGLKILVLLLLFGGLLSFSAQGQYCTSGLHTTPGLDINTFTITNPTVNTATSGTGYAAGGFDDRTATVLSMTANRDYTFTVLPTSSFVQNWGFGVWIDFNSDNDFADPGEFLGSVYDGSGFFSGTVSGRFVIPYYSSTGNRRMRIRLYSGAQLASGNSCTVYNNGETHDYTVNITGGSGSVPTTFSTAYCNPSSGGCSSSRIDNLNPGTGNLHSSGTGCVGYENYVGLNIPFTANTSQTWTATFGTNNNWPSLAVYIDFNDDGDFADANELVGQFTSGSLIQSSVAATVTVPATALNGAHRARVRLMSGSSGFTWSLAGTNTACSNTSEGETHDYTVSVTGGVSACTQPGTQATINAYTGTGNTGTTVNWTRGNGTGGVVVVGRCTSVSSVNPSSGTSYTANALFGSGNAIGNGNFVVYNGTGTSATVTGLKPGTSYTFTVYEYNTTGICYKTPGSSSAVTTTGSVSYPTVSSSIACDYNNITGVTLNSVVISTGLACASNYSDYTCTNFTGPLNVGTTYSFSVSGNPYPASTLANLGIYIDFNNNGSFSDAGDFLGNFQSASSPWTGSITIPAGASAGTYRMRVQAGFNVNTATYSANLSSYGNAHDYMAVIAASASCTAPNGTVSFGAFSGVTSAATTTNVTYTNGANTATGYVLLRNTTNTAPTAPASGTAVPTAGSTSFVSGYTVVGTSTTLGSSQAFNSTGLSASTAYYYWVVAYQNTNGPCWFRPTSQLNNSQATSAPSVTVTIANNNTVSAATVFAGQYKVLLKSATVTVSGGSATLTAFTAPTTGTYQIGDLFTGVTLWYQSGTNSFQGNGTVVGTTNIAAPGNLTATGLNVTLPAGTYYFFYTVNINSAATNARTIRMNANLTSSHFTFTGVTPTGNTSSIDGLQTISTSTILYHNSTACNSSTSGCFPYSASSTSNKWNTAGTFYMKNASNGIPAAMGAGNISSISFATTQVCNTAQTQSITPGTTNPIRIWVRNAGTSSTYTAGTTISTITSAMTLVYNSTATVTRSIDGYLQFTLPTPFYYDGTSNLEVVLEYCNISTLSTGNWQKADSQTNGTFFVTSTSSCASTVSALNAQRAITRFGWEAITACVVPNGTAGFSFTGVNPVATTVNATYTNGGNAASGYALLRSTANTAPTAPASGTTVPSAGSSVTWGGTYTVVGTTTTIGSSVAFSSTSLSCNTQYYYWVVAYQNTNGPCWFTPTHSGNAQTTQGAPSLPSTPTGNQTPCSGVSNNYTITAVPGATSYDWKLEQTLNPVGPVNTAGTTASLAFTSSGSLTVQANNSCGSSGYLTLTSRLGISVTTSPSIAFPDGQSVSIGCSILITPTPSSPSYTASGGVGISSSGGISYLTGTFVTASSVQATNGSCSSPVYPITVTAGITNRGTLASGDQTICDNQTPNSISYSTPAAGSGISYQWYYKNTNATCPATNDATTGWTSISGAQLSSYSPAQGFVPAGSTYTFACYVGSSSGSGNCGGWSSGCRKVTVNAAPTIPTITPNEISGTANDGQIFDGATITLSGPIGATTYTWSNSGGSSQTSNSFSPSSNTTYSLTVTNSASCSASNSYSVTVTACNTNTWSSGASGDLTNWFNEANWSCGIVPTSSVDVVIPTTPIGGNYFPIVDGIQTASVRDITISSSATITFSSAATLAVNGDFTNNGSANFETGELQMKGSNKILNGNFILGILNIQGNTAINASGQVNILDKLELQSAQLNTNNKLTLKSSAAKTAFVDDFSSGFNGTVTGNLSIERYVPGSGNKFHYFGALTGGTASKWNDDYTITSNATDSTAVTLDPSKPCGPTALAAGSAYGNLLTYDEKLVTNCFLKGWRVRNTNAATSRGRGFAGRVPSTTVLTEAGTYDKTNVTLSGLSVTGTNTDATSKGFHFVSNPFWAPILWSGVTGSNLYGTAYRYDPNTGSYGAYNNITAPMEISTNEAFFVRGNWATVNAGNSTFSITFPASARTTGENNTFLRSGLPYAYGVKITVNAHNTTDYTLIAFDNRFTTAHDNGYDALKLDNDFNVANIYTIDATAQRSAILALPENTATASVPLNIDIRYTDLHNLTFDLQSFPSTAMVFLEDKTTGVWHNLRVNNTYSFNATIGDNSDRFVLHFTPAAVFNATASGCENNTGIISIQQDGGITWDYEIKDQQNTTVLSGSNLTGYIEFTQLAAGNYTIALVHESGYTATENITVIATENISLTVNATANTIFVNEPVTVNAILSSNGTTNWDMGDGTVYNNTETVIHSYTVAGNYLVSATAANDNCNDTKTIDITVEENLVTGIAANNDKTLKVYASGNTVFVEQYASKELVNADLTLYNTLGQIIQQDKISELNYGAKQQINVNASNGIYYLHVVLSNGKEVQTKLLINR